MSIRQVIFESDYENKFGYNVDVDASGPANVDIAYGTPTVYFPSAAVAGTAINVSSGGTADTSTGTGARTLEIFGLNSSGYKQSEIITLAGTALAHPANSYLDIFRAKVKTSGSGATNAGTITIADGSGTLIVIPPGYGQSAKCAYTVPADYSNAYIDGYHVAVNNKTAATIIGQLLVFPPGEAWQVKSVFLAKDTKDVNKEYKRPIKVPALTKIKMRAIDASADNLPVEAEFYLTLE